MRRNKIELMFVINLTKLDCSQMISLKCHEKHKNVPKSVDCVHVVVFILILTANPLLKSKKLEIFKV